MASLAQTIHSDNGTDSDNDSIFHTSRSPSPMRTAPPSSTSNSSTHPQKFTITSEQPLLQRTHHTQGYRAGVSLGRDDPAISQQGFDDGYPVGAALGLAVGRILAVLSEKARTGGGADLKMRLAEAREELKVERLVEEMRTCGVLKDVQQQAGNTLRVEEGFVDRLPSVKRWQNMVQELTYPAKDPEQ